MPDPRREFEREALIASRSVTLADIARQLMTEDAGTALLSAALLCWERDHGKAGAVAQARTALIALSERPGCDPDRRAN